MTPPLLVSPGGPGVGFGGDAIDLQDMSANEDAIGGSANAECRLEGPGTNEGAQRRDVDGVLTTQNQTITPGSNVGDYQIRWTSPLGDNPTATTSAQNVWYAMSGGDWFVRWTQSGTGNTSGSVTVEIRRGTGPTIQTASWDGDANVESAKK